MSHPRTMVRKFIGHRRQRLMRLERVHALLSRWDEYEAAAAVPADLRPDVQKPTTTRKSLKALQGILVQTIAELEEAWSGGTNRLRPGLLNHLGGLGEHVRGNGEAEGTGDRQINDEGE